jgi:hypothetical protein
MTIYSNKLSVQAMGNQPNLEIANFNVYLTCTSNGHNITVNGTVLYNGKPLPNVTVNIGFCSAYNPTTHMFSASWSTKTNEIGNFGLSGMFTQTPPGGQNCIAAVVYFNNMYADKMMTVTIPPC